MAEAPFVSVIIACRNEGSFIGRCLASVLANHYPQDRMEILVVDGRSEDDTRQVVQRYAQQSPLIRLLDNPRHHATAAFNIGVAHARGDVIMIMGAHASYGPDYIARSVHYLATYQADNVGGVWKVVPRKDALIGRAIAAAIASPFGSGNAYTKTGVTEPRWVDTVFGGCFRREVFDRVGLFDEKLARSQDIEFNLRLRRGGGRVLLAPDITCTYYVHSTLIGFTAHNYDDGFWTFYPLRYGRRTFSLRHVVPPTFVMALVGLPMVATAIALAWPVWLGLVASYSVAALVFSVRLAAGVRDARLALVLPIVFAVRHMAYGLGGLVGIIQALISRLLRRDSSRGAGAGAGGRAGRRLRRAAPTSRTRASLRAPPRRDLNGRSLPMPGSFTRNTMTTLATQGVVFVLAIGISVLTARVLGPEGRGVYSLAVLLPVFLVYFLNFGLGHAAVYFLGQGRHSPREIFGTNLVYTGIFSLVAGGIGLLLIHFLAGSIFPNIAPRYLRLALLLVPAQLFLGFVLYILLGLREIKKYNWILLLRALLWLALLVVLLATVRLGIREFILTEFTAGVIACGVLFFWVKRRAGGVSQWGSRKYAAESLRYGMASHLGIVLSFLQSRIALPLLNGYHSPLLVGYYSISAGLSERISLIPDSVGTVLFPRVSSEQDPSALKKFTPAVLRNALILLLCLAAVLYFSGRWIILLLYSEQFLNSLAPFQVLLPGAVAHGGSMILQNDLRGRGKPLLNTYAAALSLLVSLVLYTAWVPDRGIVGAAWATSVSQFTAFLITLLIYRRVSGNTIRDMVLPNEIDRRFYQHLLGLWRGVVSRPVPG